MVIAVASGKGGTGKTTFATSLALAASKLSPVRFLDCDVEAPNAGLFLNPRIVERKEVGVPVPVVDEGLCTNCGSCATACEFHALAVVGKRVLVFPQLCHGCGSCSMVCPEQAISERLNVTGILERGQAASSIDFARGTLNVGEAMAVPVIRELKRWTRSPGEVLEVRDSPPGASCSVVESLRGADFAVLVTEPTPFGLHDLELVADIARGLGVPAGVVVNRDGTGDERVDGYCSERGLPILLRIPMERRIAEGLARGKNLIEIAPERSSGLDEVLELVMATVSA